jgi:RHS repeat-associated protein
LLNAQTAQTSAEYEYGPFGETIRATGPAAAENVFRFSAKYTDAESGLLYYGYRYRNLVCWLSRDPIEESGGLNLYGFLRNVGDQKVDYLGLSANDVCKASVGCPDLILSARQTTIVEPNVHWGWSVSGTKIHGIYEIRCQCSEPDNSSFWVLKGMTVTEIADPFGFQNSATNPQSVVPRDWVPSSKCSCNYECWGGIKQRPGVASTHKWIRLALGAADLPPADTLANQVHLWALACGVRTNQ